MHSVFNAFRLAKRIKIVFFFMCSLQSSAVSGIVLDNSNDQVRLGI